MYAYFFYVLIIQMQKYKEFSDYLHQNQIICIIHN